MKVTKMIAAMIAVSGLMAANSALAAPEADKGSDERAAREASKNAAHDVAGVHKASQGQHIVEALHAKGVALTPESRQKLAAAFKEDPSLMTAMKKIADNPKALRSDVIKGGLAEVVAGMKGLAPQIRELESNPLSDQTKLHNLKALNAFVTAAVEGDVSQVGADKGSAVMDLMMTSVISEMASGTPLSEIYPRAKATYMRTAAKERAYQNADNTPIEINEKALIENCQGYI